MIYYYRCPLCKRERRIVNVPEVQKYTAAPSCWDHEDEVKMLLDR